MHVGGFQNANQSTPQALSDAADAVYRLRSGASVDYAKEHYGFVDSNRLPAVEELDFVVKMRLGDKLFEVASALGNGEISEPVVDVDGVHVLVMDIRRPASVADFSSVRDKVYQAYRREQGERATAENVRLLRNQAQIILAPGQEE
jgi:parvulin-like peptidyl-prolyl isomerase